MNNRWVFLLVGLSVGLLGGYFVGAIRQSNPSLASQKRERFTGVVAATEKNDALSARAQADAGAKPAKSPDALTRNVEISLQVSQREYAALLQDPQLYTNHRALKKRQVEERFGDVLPMLNLSDQAKARFFEIMADHEMAKLESGVVTWTQADNLQTSAQRLALSIEQESELKRKLSGVMDQQAMTQLESFREHEDQWEAILKFNRWLPDSTMRLSTSQVMEISAQLARQDVRKITNPAAGNVVRSLLTPDQASQLDHYARDEEMVKAAWKEDDRIRAAVKKAMNPDN